MQRSNRKNMKNSVPSKRDFKGKSVSIFYECFLQCYPHRSIFLLPCSIRVYAQFFTINYHLICFHCFFFFLQGNHRVSLLFVLIVSLFPLIIVSFFKPQRKTQFLVIRKKRSNLRNRALKDFVFHNEEKIL